MSSSADTTIGDFVLSFDLELGWGSIENGAWAGLERAGVFVETRAAMNRLLAQMDELELPATFGVVGGLADDPTNISLDHLPSPMRERVSTALQSSNSASFDGRDIVDHIAGAKTRHVFCSHSYSHMRFGHPLATAEFVRHDLTLFGERFPRDLRQSDALIFPVNEEAHLEEVAAKFATCRGRPHAGKPGQRGLATKVAELVSMPLASRRSVVCPGLWKETESLLFNVGRRRWKLPFVMGRALRGLRGITGRGRTLHVWLHPLDLANDLGLADALRMYLRRVARLRDRGRLTVSTFGRVRAAAGE